MLTVLGEGMEENKVQYVKALIENTNEIHDELDNKRAGVQEDKKKKRQGKVFEKYKIKDIVFLAVIAGCMLITGGIMPLVTQVPIFGIIELAIGLQFSIFPVIGLMKVRKPGALLLISLFTGIMLAFMFLPMFLCIMLCALIVELLVLLIFRGYKSNAACVMAGTLYMPLTLPFLYVWYNFFYTIEEGEGKAVQAFIGAEPGFIIGMTVAVVALCFVGSLIGVAISKEMKKAGVLKK